MKIRRLTVLRETIRSDPFGEECTPIRRVAGLAVFTNPFAGRFERDLSPLFDIGRQIGEQLVGEALALLEKPAISYGKAALVGVGGDLEHGGAVIHPKLGAPMRAGVGGGAALIPSNVKVSAVGATIDIPLGNKDDPWSFDHFDTMTVMVPDAPRPEEIVLCVGYADGGRPHPRCGSGPIRQ
jgi:hypothetical protein